jgi:hypothetical protein
MTIAQKIKELDFNAAQRENLGAFLRVSRLLTAHKGSSIEALQSEEGQRSTQRVQTILKNWRHIQSQAIEAKTAVSPLAISSELSDYQNITEAFNLSLRSLSVFDAMLANGMVRAPLRSRGLTVTTGISGSVPSEQTIKPISSLVLGTSLLEPKKATAIVVATQELMRQPGADTLFNTELQRAVAAATDSVFLAGLVAATTPTASAGATLANITTDLSVLLSAVTTDATSQLYYITSPANMKKLMLKAQTSGNPAFPNLGPNGGQLLPGVTAIASDQVGSGVAILVAADAVAGNADLVTLDASEQSILQMSTTPDSPETASTIFLSLWQTDHRALRCERYFGFVVCRTSGVASLSGVSY